MKKIVKILIIILGISNAFASNTYKQLGVDSLALLSDNYKTNLKIDINQLIHKRWWSIDPKANKFPSQSPYNFVENNPIQYVDPEGEFKKKFNTKKYPTLSKIIDEARNYVLNQDKRILPKLIKYGNVEYIFNGKDNHKKLSKDLIKKELKNGEGPEIILEPQKGRYGMHRKQGQIILDEISANELMDKNTPAEVKYYLATQFIISLLHEYIHDLNGRSYGNPKNFGEKGPDTFEKDLNKGNELKNHYGETKKAIDDGNIKPIIPQDNFKNAPSLSTPQQNNNDKPQGESK